jgi:hypothetical protein
MSLRLETLAREKRGLLERLALSRLQLHLRTRDVRDALLRRPPIGPIAVGIALTVIGIGPMARAVGFARRVLLYVRLVRSVIGLARGSVA